MTIILNCDIVINTYDKAGNIETITENGKLVARYTYDGLNRLVREDNARFGTVIYRYDAAGNILSKTHYAFTLKDELGEIVNEYEYSYRQHGWRDQLLSFGEANSDIKEDCKYDALGNPLSYKGRTLAWQGRRLISYGIDNKQATYTYDFNNVRTSKTATDGTTSVTSKYIYDGNNLIAEQRTVKGPDKDKSVWLYYIYGVDGIAGFKFEDKVYLYRKNVQGDITHIYRKDGNKDLVEVAHYAYDAFGNTEILSETDKIGALNPFRYRGYYFDIETKLYYLISRYYDPETCRFISADSIEYLDPETLGGLNLYAYCCNNPVMMVDEDGNKPKWWQWLVAALIVVAVTTAMVATAGLAAAAIGASAAVTTGMCVGAGVATATAGAMNLFSQASQGVDEINLGSLLTDMLISGTVGMIVGGISGGLGAFSATGLKGTQLLVHMAVQGTANALLSAGIYFAQSAITGEHITLWGTGVAIIGGFVSGLCYNWPATKSFILAVGTEIAGYGENIWQMLINSFKKIGNK